MPEPGAPPLHQLDRLRVGLTALVVAHHSAIVHGGAGSWFWRERPPSGDASSILLSLLCGVDQAFFMGAFFLLAGVFTPGAIERHGPWRWLGGRLLRLGLPLLLFGAVLGPFTVALAATARGEDLLGFWTLLMRRGSWVPGPLWFNQALLLMAVVALGWRAWRLRSGRAAWLAGDAPLPSAAAWWWSAAGVALAAWLLRLQWPVGTEWAHLQLGYFASYVFLFAVGCAAGPAHWLQRLPAAQAARWASIARRSFALLPLTGLAFGALQGQVVNYAGGWGLPAIVYALWEPLLAWGIIATLLVHGRERWALPSPGWQALAGHAYGAFVLHPPLLVAISLWMRPWAAPALLKWLLLAVLATVASFASSALLRRWPAVRRVL